MRGTARGPPRSLRYPVEPHGRAYCYRVILQVKDDMHLSAHFRYPARPGLIHEDLPDLRVLARLLGSIAGRSSVRDGLAPCYNRPAPEHAGVAELVDAPDSKSGAPKGACRFEPDLRYQEIPAK